MRSARSAALLAIAIVAGCGPTATGGDGGATGEPIEGRVLDAVTGIGIPQIEVACIVSGDPLVVTRSGGFGEFGFAAGASCGLLRATDVDGPANGSYQTADGDAAGGDIELSPL